MQEEKKTLKEEDLSQASAGSGPEDTPMILCNNCDDFFSPYSAERRFTSDNCSEYRCPSCGTWQKYD